MIKRLPESWIPPDHLLDLRARVRLRHTLSEQRSECSASRPCSITTAARRAASSTPATRVAGRAAAAAGREREQVTIALAMIDAPEAQIAPLDRELRAFARRQAGCRALMAHYGIGELTAVTILAELGDCRRFSSLAPSGPLRRHGHHRAPV